MDASSRINIDQVKEMARTIPTGQLFDMAGSDNLVVARNALWALTHKKDSELSLLPQQMLIDMALSADDVTVRRFSLSLVERQELRQEELRVDFLDFCLSNMIDIDVPTGVQALCLKLAYRMCSFYPELLAELERTLEHIHIEHYKPGMRCTIKKVSSQIMKQKHKKI